jgi:uncharacterized membrane protein
VRRLVFEAPVFLYAGLPLVGLVLVLFARSLGRSGLVGRKRALLVLLRGLGLGILVFLLARPVEEQGGSPEGRRAVVVLLDQSRSMGLEDRGPTRYAQAIAYAKRDLIPALLGEGFSPKTWSFAEGASATTFAEAERADPRGSATDIAGAILHSSLGLSPRPAAIVALTDGAANIADANPAALSELVDSGTPFIGVGIGDDQGVPTLSLRRLSAPSRVPVHEKFRLLAHLEATSIASSAFELYLLRDGAMVQTRHVATDGSGSRIWAESFDLTEDAEGLHTFTVVLNPPRDAKVITVNARSSVPVRFGAEKDFRVLFVQGALTWDYKFIGRALRGDSTVRLTGLSRTSKQSIFRQNVENAGELTSGFPQDLGEIAPYRVVALAELKPSDLTPAQQDLLARYCGELGGGLLMIGGPSTFDESWQGSRLEQLLPVTFDQRGVSGLDRPFHLRLTERASRSPVFQVVDDGHNDKAWDGIPAFSGYGRVLKEKPGATVWALHDTDVGPNGPRILMASQYYGAGQVAIIGVQNFWRWRLARGDDPARFDRFWRQLFHYLGQAGGDAFDIEFQTEGLRAHSDVRATVERRPRPEGTGHSGEKVTLSVRGPDQALLVTQKAAVEPLHPVEVRFRAEGAGIYTLGVEGSGGEHLASQPVEILETDREMEHTGRDMDVLKQWATASGGLAMPIEEATDARALARAVRAKVTAARSGHPRPLGLTAPVMSLVLLLLGGGWWLRRMWNLR